MLPTELDFGLGTFKGEPKVGVTMGGKRFHRHDHGGRYYLITWTYGYVTDKGSCGIWQPCPTCFPGHPPIAYNDGPALNTGEEATGVDW